MLRSGQIVSRNRHAAAGKTGHQLETEILDLVGVEPVEDFLRLLGAHHETGFEQVLQVARDRRLREIEKFDNLSDRTRFRLQHQEDFQPRLVSQRL